VKLGEVARCERCGEGTPAVFAVDMSVRRRLVLCMACFFEVGVDYPRDMTADAMGEEAVDAGC